MRKNINQENYKNKLFNQSVLYKADYVLELSGQIGTDSNTKSLIDDTIENQTRQTLNNIANIIAQVGWSLNNIVKVRVYLTDMANYQKMNEIYAEFFSTNQPARIALSVKELPAKALIEIECTAVGKHFDVKDY